MKKSRSDLTIWLFENTLILLRSGTLIYYLLLWPKLA